MKTLLRNVLIHLSLGASIVAAPQFASAETAISASTATPALTENQISELLAQGRCQDALQELHLASFKSSTAKLDVLYGRAYAKCGQLANAQRAYRRALNEEQSLSPVELEEVRRALALSAPPPATTENGAAEEEPGRRLRLSDRDAPSGYVYVTQPAIPGLKVCGGVLTTFGMLGAIGGLTTLVVGSASKSYYGGQSIGMQIAGGSTLAATAVLFLIPGVIMLVAGKERQELVTSAEAARLAKNADDDVKAAMPSRDELPRIVEKSRKMAIAGGTIMGLGIAGLIAGPIMLTARSSSASIAGMATTTISLFALAPTGIITFAIGMRNYRKYSRMLESSPELAAAASRSSLSSVRVSPYFSGDGGGMVMAGQF